MIKNFAIQKLQKSNSVFGYIVLFLWLCATFLTPRGIVAMEAPSPANTTTSSDIIPILEEIIGTAGAPTGSVITLNNPALVIPQSLETLTQDQFIATTYSQTSGRFITRLHVKNRSVPITITGEARPPIIIPILIYSLARGDKVSEDNIDWVERTDIRSGTYIDNSEELIGKIARRPLKAGIPLRHHDVKKPILVKKGSIVTMTYESAGLSLTHNALAEDNGGIGDVIAVRNPKTERLIKAIVAAPGKVAVLSSPSALQVHHP